MVVKCCDQPAGYVNTGDFKIITDSRIHSVYCLKEDHNEYVQVTLQPEIIDQPMVH